MRTALGQHYRLAIPNGPDLKHQRISVGSQDGTDDQLTDAVSIQIHTGKTDIVQGCSVIVVYDHWAHFLIPVSFLIPLLGDGVIISIDLRSIDFNDGVR